MRTVVARSEARSRLVAAGLLAAIFLATATFAVLEYLRQDWAETQRDQELADATAAAMEGVVRASLAAGATASALVDDAGHIPDDRFERFARSVATRPGVVSVAWEQHVPAGELKSFQEATGIPVWERSAGGAPVPVRGRAAYLPVVQVWPEAYGEIIGYDLLSDPARAEAATDARDQGRPAVTSPLELAVSQRRGVLVTVPLYRPGMPITTTEQRREAFAGAVTVSHVTDTFLAYMPIQPGMRVRLTDDGELLTATSLAPPPDDPGAEATVEIAGRTWTVQVRHPDRSSLTNMLWITVVGLGLAVAVGWSLRQTGRHVDELRRARDQLARMMSTVQHGSLRAPATPLPGLDIAVRYLPAAEHARLGGDWYDLLTTEDGRTIITVGDISGHGIAAITHMQQVRQVISAFAFEGHSPATALRLADEVLRSEPMASGHFATVWLGYLHPSRRTLIYANAGHPPALTSSPGGPSRLLDTDPGPPLNLGLEASAWVDHEVELAAGSVLLVCTDGVVESRTDGIDAGVALALDLVAEHDRPLDDLAEAVMGARPDPGRDDAALVLVRLHAAGTAVADRDAAASGKA